MQKLPKLPSFFNKNKITVSLILVLVILFGGGFLAYKFILNASPKVYEEIDMPFDPEGAYGLLIPRRDGNALNLSVKRIASYEEFSYELSYSDKSGVSRGAGSPDTWIKIDKKHTEFNQEILLGSCSQGFTTGKEHCVFDEGVENGTLTLRMRKEDKVYKMTTTWHLQQPDVALGELTSGDNHFQYKTTASRNDLSLVAYSVVNDLSGLPKLQKNTAVIGKVYALNIPSAKTLPQGDVTIELAEDLPEGSEIGYYTDSKNYWERLDSKIAGSTITAVGRGAGIYAVLVHDGTDPGPVKIDPLP